MTLVLALGNSEQVIQISDRRFTADGKLLDDESNKAVIVSCLNARLAIGFAGLAVAGQFKTRDWIIDTFIASAPLEFLILPTMRRFVGNANRQFLDNRDLRGLDPVTKRLSILVSGYVYHHEPPLLVYAIVTNYQDIGKDYPEAWSEFRFIPFSERRPSTSNEEITMVQRIGNWQVVEDRDVSELRLMLRERRPARAILDKGYDVVRKASGHARARGLIGKQLSSCVIPRNRDAETTYEYSTSVPTNSSWAPDYILLVPDDGFATKDFEFRKISGSLPSEMMLIPRVRNRNPCPCGSGLRYRRCHGRLAR